MAQVILSGVGQALGGPVGAVIGATLGRAIDQQAISSLGPARQRGPRLETLRVQGSAEGAPLTCVFGRARVTGQVIWAARFLEGRKTSSSGKGGPRTTEYDYSLSFAVALCEGEIDGIGRVWADGRPMDLSGVTLRVYPGGDQQTPDPLIEAVEGDGDAFLIGVQWHPEVLEMADPHTRHLFGGFIRAAMDWSTANSTSRVGVGG